MSFDRFAIDPMETTTSRPLTTSDLDTTNTSFRIPSSSRSTALPQKQTSFSSFAPPQAPYQPPLSQPPSRPPFFPSTQAFPEDPRAKSVNFASSLPRAHQSSALSTIPQRQTSPQLGASHNRNVSLFEKSTFALMGGEREDRPEEDDFYNELLTFHQDFKRGVRE